MIDVIIAGDQEILRIGMAETLAAEGDVCVVGQPQSPEQLMNTLKRVEPHLLILSTSFLPAISRIQRTLKRRQTALLVLTDENDRVAYLCWLHAQGIVYRSMDVPVILDAMRRVARGELFLQNRSSDLRTNLPKLHDGERHPCRSQLSARWLLTATVRSPQSDFVRSASPFLLGSDGFCACVSSAWRSNLLLRLCWCRYRRYIWFWDYVLNGRHISLLGHLNENPPVDVLLSCKTHWRVDDSHTCNCASSRHAYAIFFLMSSTLLPHSHTSKSSSVSLPQFSFADPINCFHLPST